MRTLVERDLRVRYKRLRDSASPGQWSTRIQVFVLTVAVGYILGSGPKNLSAYIFCATLPWTFFQTASWTSSTSVLTKLSLLKKVYFPRDISLIATVCQNFVQFGISLLVFVAYRWGLTTALYGWPGAPPREILWLPVIVLLLFLLTLGVSFFVCAANVFYEDVKFIVANAMTFLFYLVPIIYFPESIFFFAGFAALALVGLPPVPREPARLGRDGVPAGVFPPGDISARGASVIYSAPLDYRYFAIAAVLSVAICLSGYSYYRPQVEVHGAAMTSPKSEPTCAVEVENLVKEFRVYHRTYASLKSRAAALARGLVRRGEFRASRPGACWTASRSASCPANRSR